MRSGARGALVYAQAAASEPRQVLEQIDELLAALGTSKSKLLTARVLVSDADLFAHYESAWNTWLDRLPRPLRVWKLAEPRHQEPLVDVTVTATK
jgi:enamine deaminase RidA (YjgF/YER057c/UK114 family)